MTRYFTLFASILLFFSCSEKEMENDLKTYEVQGKVRQIQYKGTENSNGNTIRFNTDGLVLSERFGGRLFSYKYDGMYANELKVFLGDSLEIKRLFTYKNNIPTEIREYDKRGTLQKKVIYKYDKNGNRTQGIILTTYNDTLSMEEYEYEQNLIIKKTRYTYNEHVEQTDETSQQIRSYIRAYATEYSYTYNENKELETCTETIGDEPMSKLYYKNFHGVDLTVSEVSYWGGTKDSSIITYGFDEKGNWIFKRTMSNNREQRQERSILYYK
ncbi:MAG: hypothetical protein MJ197_09125 [Bacteroidales bacterium]|nr:hypothetical protein [Bacteroidales bacterium]